MRVRFHIERRKGTSGNLLARDRPVLMSVTFEGKRVILGTGIKVDIDGWDPDLQRIKTYYERHQSLNNRLESLKEIAFKTKEALDCSDIEVTPENFRHLFNRMKPTYSSGFFDLYYHFMESNSSSWSIATYRKIRSHYYLLKEFEDHAGYSLSFHGMNARFLDSFLAFCSEKGYMYSTTYKAINNLVWFLNWATEKGYNVFRDYRQFYKLMDTPEKSSQMLLYLRWDELMQLWEYSTETVRMERARDLFCFMCFTGIRFTELQHLKKEDLKLNEFVVKRPGRVRRTIPMNKYALHIFRKYENKYYLNNSAFPSMSVITMNKYLRLMGRAIGFKREIRTSPSNEESFPLYSRLTAGIAVNTFINNAVELEVPIEIISGFTGVASDSRILRIKSDRAVEEMSKFESM